MFSRIKELCSQKNTTVTALERECGFSKGSMCKWEKSNPSYDRIQKVAELLEVSAQWLATGEGPKYPLDLQRFAGEDPAQGTKKDQADPKADLVKKWLATYDMLTESERAEVETFIQFKLSQRKQEGE